MAAAVKDGDSQTVAAVARPCAVGAEDEVEICQMCALCIFLCTYVRRHWLVFTHHGVLGMQMRAGTMGS